MRGVEVQVISGRSQTREIFDSRFPIYYLHFVTFYLYSLSSIPTTHPFSFQNYYIEHIIVILEKPNDMIKNFRNFLPKKKKTENFRN